MLLYEITENGIRPYEPPKACKDLVVVVRCKDCTAHDNDKWCHAMSKHTENDFFCADGVKKDD